MEYFDPKVTVPALLAILTFAFSAYKFYQSVQKDRQEKQAERADRERAAAAVALTQLERWQLLNLSLYDRLQSTFVETSEMLSEEFNIERARDHLWKQINALRVQVRQSIADEEISTSYVGLMPHFPFWRTTYRDTLRELDAIEEFVYWQLLINTQSDVQAFYGRKDEFTNAKLGNYLRSTAEESRQEFIRKTDLRIAPIHELLVEIISKSDTDILQQTPELPDRFEKRIGRSQQDKTAILWLGANPRDSVRLNIKDEVLEIQRQLDHAPDAFEFTEKWAVSANELQDLLMQHRPTLIHFSGHGNSNGEIELHSTFNVAMPVPRQAITALFKLLGDDVQCVVLNACYSQQQGMEIAKHVGCVIGMTDEVSDVSAIEFSSAFYGAISRGQNVKQAFSLAVNSLELQQMPNDDVPELVDPFNRAKDIVLLPKRINR